MNLKTYCSAIDQWWEQKLLRDLQAWRLGLSSSVSIVHLNIQLFSMGIGHHPDLFWLTLAFGGYQPKSYCILYLWNTNNFSLLESFDSKMSLFPRKALFSWSESQLVIISFFYSFEFEIYKKWVCQVNHSFKIPYT